MDQTTPVFPEMLAEKQTARVLKVSEAALRRWRSTGQGPPFVRLGRCVRYDLRAIEKFLAEHSSGQLKDS